MVQSAASPQKGGSGAFIAAAVAMLAIMGGLIFWKLRGSDVAPQPTATAPPPASTPPQIFDQPPPPPPPPPPEVEDAGTKTTARIPGGVATGVCAGECKGTAGGTLQSALASKAGASRGCYERGLRQNPTLSGKLVVSVRVGPAGQVCSAGVASNALGDPGVASCVVGMFRSATFPPPQGGCIDAQVPMNFVPKGGGK